MFIIVYNLQDISVHFMVV